MEKPEMRIYRNLHKNCMSVQQKKKDGRGKISWRVLFHTNNIFLKDVQFHVNEGGRKRVLEEKKKNVHAFVKGFFVEGSANLNTGFRLVSYNPYKGPSFFLVENGEPIFSARFVAVVNGVLWAKF
jgi:hypothetical protein